MAFQAEDDPYPPSLPMMDSPVMATYGPPSAHSANPFIGQEYPSSAPNLFDCLQSEDMLSHNMLLPQDECGTTVHPAYLSLDPSRSAEPSPTSSSNSSLQHQRHASSNSSTSATLGFDPTIPDDVKMRDLMLRGPTFAEFPKQDLTSTETEDDVDRQMSEIFDFDSAANSAANSTANSPGDSIATETSPAKPIAGMAMPHCEQALQRIERQIMQPHQQRRLEAVRSAVSTPSSFKPDSLFGYPTAWNQRFDFAIHSGLLNNVPHNPFCGGHPTPNLANNAGFVGPNSFGYPQATFVPPAANFTGLGHTERPVRPILHIHPISSKTRVETQIPITMTLEPMPPGITRLHLPTRTMAKPKLIAKPPAMRSPDMLELDVMPVCASAMERPHLCLRACEMAWDADASPQVRHQLQRSSSDGSDTGREANGRIDPMEGGPISICDGCMMRERKRANRRVEKEASDEDIRWKLGEKERIVVFNENEIVDWKPYGSPELDEPASKRARGGRGKKKDDADGDMPTSHTPPEPVIQYPDLAMQVRLMMRITCYCRHQGEQEGFRVIISLKDHHGRRVAQGMSTPILITDDHKTSAPQNDGRNPTSAHGSRLPNGNFLPSVPSGNVGPAPQVYNLGQSHSTTDLPTHNPHFTFLGTQRSATSYSLRQQAQLPGTRSIGVSTPSRDPSYRTSVTLTPRNLSRQVSPSAASGPSPKRRKGSGFSSINHRPLVDLSMTRMPPMETDLNRSLSPSASPVSSNEATDGLFMAPAAASAPPPTGETPAAQHAAEPDSDTLSSIPPRSSSSDPMEDVPASHQSNSQSPQPVQSQPPNPDMTAHAQALHHSLLHLAGAAPPAVVPPRVFRVIPSEGPKSGGIEVTILGLGFHPGLDVLFANAVATKTSVLNNKTIVCIIPPCFREATVQVSLRGLPPSEHQVWFHYIDTDERDLMRLALAVFHHRNTGQIAHPGDIARSIIDGQQPQDNQQSHGGAQHPLSSGFHGVDLELSLLGVIDVIDQTDSVIPPRYDVCQPNGQTMLHLAASLGYHRLVAGLLARGLNPDLRDRNGMSAMHMACLQGHTKVVRKLVSAGGDPALRSLLGLAPTDMATTRETRQVMLAIARHSRSRSVGATPVSHLSRASSVTSMQSIWGRPLGNNRTMGDVNVPYNTYSSRPVTPAEVWTRSRRNSGSDKQRFLPEPAADYSTVNTHMVAATAAMTAWRDNLAGQIQHFQQSVQRTLPYLQIPNLPPLPNFEGYQGHPVVRRISSLVPRMNTPPAPPAYDEIYPESTEHDADVKKASAARAIGDAFADGKCAANFDGPKSSSGALIRTLSEADSKARPGELGFARDRRVKKLSNDRKLFFVWIPLLIFVVIAMMKDWAPQILRGAQHVLTTLQDYLAN